MSDEILRILGALTGGAMKGYNQSNQMNKANQQQKDMALLTDSLGMNRLNVTNEYNQDNALLEDSLATSRDNVNYNRDVARDSVNYNREVDNVMLQDSLDRARLENTQSFQKGNQALNLFTALGSSMTDTKNQELNRQVNEGDFRYDDIRVKVKALEDAKRDARGWTPNLSNLNRRTLQFRTEKPFPFSEKDMLDDYTEVRDDLEQTVRETLLLSPNNPKRRGVLKFVNKMVKRAGHTDFLDGDWGIFGGVDPDGGQAQAIKDELETWQALLKDEESSNTLLDDMYNISPEERKFYQDWRGQRSAISSKKISNVDAEQADLKSMLRVLIEQSKPNK